MNKNNNVHELTNHLGQEIAWLKELNTTLANEKEALEKRKFTLLDKFAQKKQELTLKLEESSQERMRLIGDPDTQSPSVFLEKFLEQCNKEEAIEVKALNSELSTLLVKCRELNTVNGQVIATNMHTHQEIVSILTGNKIKDVSVYTATGDIQSPKGSESTHHEQA